MAPSYYALSHVYSSIRNCSKEDLQNLIEGNVKNPYRPLYLDALRMSYALNMTGTCPTRSDGPVSMGKDGNFYMHTNDDIIRFIAKFEKPWGPLRSTTETYKADFKGKKGIIVFSSVQTGANFKDVIDMFNGCGLIANNQSRSHCRFVTLYPLN